jgi:hypothetical protein
MLLTGDQTHEDKSVDTLTAAILDRDQSRVTDLFVRMVTRDGRSLGAALGVVTAAEAPFVQVPSHINVRDGQITLVNNDHTILGLRASASLAPFLPETHRLLPFLHHRAGECVSPVRRRSQRLPGHGRGDGLQVPGRPAQPEDHPLHL